MTTAAAASMEGFPLSPQQRALWRARQGDPAFPGVTRVVVSVDGALDPQAVLRGVSLAAARHEILRTAFRRPPGMQMPLQVIDPAISPAARLAPTSESALARELADEAAAPLDLEAGPLVRVTLFTVGSTPRVLSICGSAMVLDVPSALLLAREICGDASSGTTEPPLQYADVAAWQDDALGDRGPEAESARAHWRSLHDVRGSAVPQQHVGPVLRRRARTPIALPDASREALRRLAARLSVGVDDVLLAAWLTYLARVNAEDQAVTTLATDGRSYPELRGAMGPLAKTLPLRLAFDGDPTFSGLVRRVRAAADDARAAQDQWVDGEGDCSAPVESAVCLVAEGADERSGSVRSPLEIGSSVDPVHVRLVISEPAGVVSLQLDHDVSALDAGAGADVAESFATCLDSLLATPDRGIRAASLVSESQRERIATLLDASVASLSRSPVPITDAVAEWARRTPTAAAVSAGDRTLTYAELQRRAEAVAAALVARGVRQGDVVALCADRDVGAPVGMLGILLSGAAFLPIDPSYPAERISFMLADSRVRTVVVSGGAAGALSAHSLPTVDLSQVADARLAAPRAGADAYVVYTSGTTGTPRGVVVRSAALAHYAVAIGDVLGVGPDDVYLHTASLGFSSTIRQLLMPLARGASVVIASEDDRRDPLALFALVRARGVTVIDLVPSYLRAVTRVLRDAPIAVRTDLLGNRLRLIASASEALHSDLPHAWRNELGFRGHMVNMYGLTETTGIVATLDIRDDDQSADGVHVVPVGRPLPGLRFSVLDDRLAPVPLGAVGELAVGGASVDSAFLNDAVRTAERFVPDPLRASGTVFRTGDRVRVTAAGVVEYVGRGDDVVKIRGVRVALGDVEVALARHPAVREAAAAAHGAAPTLVGYVVARDGVAIDERELRQFVAGILPSHLVPATVVTLDSLPLTRNGKLDRKALPAPDDARQTRAAAKVAPRDILEDALSGIWAEVLGVERVGVEDDFFDLGGHSLLATQLVARVREVFRSNITLRSLFESRTVAEQARALRSAAAADAPLDTIAAIVVRTRDLTPEAVRDLLAARTTGGTQ